MLFVALLRYNDELADDFPFVAFVLVTICNMVQAGVCFAQFYFGRQLTEHISAQYQLQLPNPNMHIEMGPVDAMYPSNVAVAQGFVVTAPPSYEEKEADATSPEPPENSNMD
eukprot:TRINITY_DN11678_c0_g1_i2.p1 TRINITY_DN11678_c0_g1~~TRINITY_DN11678_c0_g1_i2.p1  ORF type:complete len:112 (+),score=18.60 TRINITY_DN11678_c0_g1_i2:593-928(+)